MKTQFSDVALLSPDEMARADQATAERGVPTMRLMERAGQAVARAARSMVDPGARILVLCGPGNNGGDGFVAARCLAAAGFQTDVQMLRSPESLKGDALEAFARMRQDITLLGEEAGNEHLPQEFGAKLAAADLVIDAMFGAGLDRALEGQVRIAVEAVNQASAKVLAVDLPSGVNGARGEPLGTAIYADVTVTFFRKKPGHLLMPGRRLCGKVMVEDIGIVPAVLEDITPRTFENGVPLWQHAWPLPDDEGHKYSRGHAVVFGGKLQGAGAARLSVGAALRAGAGLATLASPPDALLANACHLTAVMLKKVADTQAIEDLLADKRLNAVLIGPGYGVGEETCRAVETILRQKRHCVLDADALTSFENVADVLFQHIAGSPAHSVLTPHDGEFKRLFPNLNGDRLSRARQAAAQSAAVVILKGADTVIAAPDGRAAINANAPAWLATAGSGDVLAGIATGLLAQGVPGFEAACQAVWLHGAAGKIAGAGLTAEDLEPALKIAIAELVDKLARM